MNVFPLCWLLSNGGLDRKSDKRVGDTRLWGQENDKHLPRSLGTGERRDGMTRRAIHLVRGHG